MINAAANSVFIVFGLMAQLEFLTLFGSFIKEGQENVSNSQTQQIRETWAAIIGAIGTIEYE